MGFFCKFHYVKKKKKKDPGFWKLLRGFTPLKETTKNKRCSQKGIFPKKEILSKERGEIFRKRKEFSKTTGFLSNT